MILPPISGGTLILHGQFPELPDSPGDIRQIVFIMTPARSVLQTAQADRPLSELVTALE